MNDFEITLKKFEIQSIKSPVVEIINFKEFGHKKKLVLTFDESTIALLKEADLKKRGKFYKKRIKLWSNYKNCFYCKRVLTFEESTIDHYIPKSKGGSNALENLRISCRECNLSKADQMPMNNE